MLLLLLLLPLSLSLLPDGAPRVDDLRVEHVLESRHAGVPRRLTVQLPDSYRRQADRDYPVLYLLDGESNLEHAAAVASFLAENALVPEVIVAAVHAGPTRAQDYLPSNAAGGPGGDGEGFLEELVLEIVPFVEREYRAAPLRLLSGHSYGGVLVLLAMTERPGAFTAFLAQSPYLDEAIGDPLLGRLASALDESERRDVRFHAVLGDEPDLAASFRRLEGLLEGADGAALTTDASKSHMTTRLVGLYDGLEHAFAGTWAWTQEDVLREGYEGLARHLEELDERYGYPVLYSESAFRMAIQVLLSSQRADEALRAGELYVGQYPRSVVGQYLLASAAAASGDRARALEAVEAGLASHASDPRPDLAGVVGALRQLRAALGGE